MRKKVGTAPLEWLAAGLATIRDKIAPGGPAGRRPAADRLAAMQACAGDVFFETDADLAVTWISRPAAGWSLPLRLGDDAVPGPGDSSASVAHRRDLDGRRAFQGVAYRLPAGTGDPENWRHYRLSAQPCHDRKGRFTGYAGAAGDITDILAAEAGMAAARRGESLLRDAIDNLAAGFVLFDRHDRVALVNQTYHRLAPELADVMVLDAHFETVLQRAIQTGVVPRAQPDPQSWVTERLAKHRKGGVVATIAVESGRILQITDCPLSDGSVLLFYVDITDLKAREAALAAQSRLLETTLDSIGEALCLIDAEHRLIIWNDSFRALFDLAPDAVYSGRPFAEILAFCADRGDFRDLPAGRVIAELTTALSDPDDRRSHSFRRRDATIDMRRRTIPDGGRVVTFIDMSEQKRVESVLQSAKEQAEMANRAKTNFLANMSHELRTPLNAIIGFSEILKDEILGPIGTKKYLDYVRDIHMSGEHLLSVINDILDLSKVESGTVELYEVAVDIRRVMQSTGRLLRERATRGDLTIDIDVPQPFAALFADERAIKQILINLLSNAVKFTDPGGRITLSAGMAGDGGVTLNVTDTGIGMRPEDIPKVLAPFAQLDSSLARRYAGTGLGLPLVKSLIELHGGRLEIDSTPGRGTTVRAWFPPARVQRADRADRPDLSAV